MFDHNHNRDYYDILGLTQGSSPSKIKKSYYNLALKWHPDKHSNKREATNKFNEISEAYSNLIDPKRKEIYDKYGHEGIRRLENNQNPNHPGGMNAFLQKGFCGTDKSAFEFLWDILKEEPQEFENPEEQTIFDPFSNTDQLNDEGFGANFESFLRQSFDLENEDGEGFGFSEPSFVNTELFNPFLMTFGVPKNDNTAPRNNNNNQWFSFSEQDCGRQSAYHQESEIEELSSKLQEFQSSLNHFHRKLKNNINPEGSLSPNSKKILKPEKPAPPSYFQKRHDNYVIFT